MIREAAKFVFGVAIVASLSAVLAGIGYLTYGPINELVTFGIAQTALGYLMVGALAIGAVVAAVFWGGLMVSAIWAIGSIGWDFALGRFQRGDSQP